MASADAQTLREGEGVDGVPEGPAIVTAGIISRLEAGGWRLEAGGWRLEAGG
jgi:hypothetical protein